MYKPASFDRRSSNARGDLFTQLGDEPALTSGDIVGPAIAAEDLFRYFGSQSEHGRHHPQAG
jgi:hypothetical protein